MLRFQVIALYMQYFADNKTSNFVTKLSRTLQLDGEWEVDLAEIDYPHTWYNIREGKDSVEIYVPDKWFQEISIQPGYYVKVQDATDAFLKAGLANATDVVVSYKKSYCKVCYFMLLLTNCEVHTGKFRTAALKYGPNEVRSV